MHAVTVHWMEAEIDSGPVAYSASFAIDAADKGLLLTTNCVRHGVPLVLRLVTDAARDRASRRLRLPGRWRACHPEP